MGVNYAPVASFGGWSGGVSSGISQEKKDAAYAYFSYVAQPAQANVDVTIARPVLTLTGPRSSRTCRRGSANGFSEKAANDYLGAIESSLSSPNMVLDLRVSAEPALPTVVTDPILAQFLAGEYTAEEAAKAIKRSVEEITEEIGREGQLAPILPRWV